MEETTEPGSPSQTDTKRPASRPWRRNIIGLGAAAAVLSASLAVLANLSEIAGWFQEDETRLLVEETRGAIEQTDARVEELVTLLRNQAAASGLNLDIESEEAIKNAIQAIVATGNAQKKTALELLDKGDVQSAADAMSRVAESQASAVSQTSDAAAETWREAGALYFSLDVERALKSYEAADRLQPDNPETLDMLGNTLVRAGKLDEAESTFNRALALSPPPDQQASGSIGLGNVAKRRGLYDQAKGFFQRSLTVAETNDLPAKQAHALHALAALAREQGELELAGNYLDRALTIAESTGDELLTAKIYSALGTQAAMREDWPEANRQITRALDIYRKRNDLGGQNSTISNLGAIALMTDDLESANHAFLESVEIGRKLGYQSSIAIDLINLATIAARRGDFESGHNYLDQAAELTRAHELKELDPVITFNRGEMAFHQEDIESACRLWGEAQPALEAMGSAYLERTNRRIEDNGCGDG